MRFPNFVLNSLPISAAWPKPTSSTFFPTRAWSSLSGNVAILTVPTMFLPAAQSGSAVHCSSPRCQVHVDGRRPRECRARGCHAAVPRSCASGFCATHCTSVWCSLHCGQDPVCSEVSCTSPPSPSCLVGACPQHCNHPQCVPCAPGRVTPSRPPRVRICRLQLC